MLFLAEDEFVDVGHGYVCTLVKRNDDLKWIYFHLIKARSSFVEFILFSLWIKNDFILLHLVEFEQFFNDWQFNKWIFIFVIVNKFFVVLWRFLF